MVPVGSTPAGDLPPDRPWARSPREIDEAYGTLAVQLRQLAGRPGRDVTQLTPGEHYALGVRAAASWTTGRLSVAPLTDDELPADVASAVKVMALAEYLMTSEGVPEQAVALAAGVRAWLTWLVGVEDRMVLRPLD